MAPLWVGRVILVSSITFTLKLEDPQEKELKALSKVGMIKIAFSLLN